MYNPLLERIRNFGKTVPQKPPTGPGTPSQTGLIYGTTPSKPKRKSSGSSRPRPSPPPTSPSDDMPEGLRQAYEEQGTIPPLEDSKVTQPYKKTQDKYDTKTYGTRPSNLVTSTDVKKDIYSKNLPVLYQGYETYQSIDPSQRYRLESGEIVTGTELRRRIGKDIYQGMIDVSKASSRVSPGSYVKTDSGEYYKIDKKTRFIIEQTDPKEQKEIMSSFGNKKLSPKNLFNLTTPTQDALQRGYEKLSSGEKESYGYMFTDWEKIPISEQPSHLGFETRYKRMSPKEKQQFLDEYTKSPEFLSYIKTVEGETRLGLSEKSEFRGRDGYLGERIPTSSEKYFFTELDTKKGKRNVAEAMIEGKSKDEFFESLHPSVQYERSFLESFTKTVAYPVTMPQIAVKYLTGEGDYFKSTKLPYTNYWVPWFNVDRLQSGKTQILPDVAMELEKRSVNPTQGLIAGTISTLMEDNSFIKSGMKYPSAFFFASMGELAGFYVAGKGTSAVKPYAIKGLGYAKRVAEGYTKTKIPISYEAFQFAKIRYHPKTYLKRGVYRIIHKKRPTPEIFPPDVMEGASFSRLYGTVDDMIQVFELKRNPITGKIPVTHGTRIPIKTKLRSRPSAFMFDDQGNILLMQHDNLKTFLTPGGGKKWWEFNRSALVREVAEELGVKTTNVQKLFSFPDYQSANLYTIYKTGIKGTPKNLAETTGFKFFDMTSKTFEKADKAWHVDTAAKKFIAGDLSSIDVLGGNTLKRYPDVFVTGVGRTSSDVTAGLFIVPEGYQPMFPFGFKSKAPELSTKSISLWSRYKPTIIKSYIDDVVRLPQGIRYSIKLSDDWLKHSHKSIMDTIQGAGGPSDFFDRITAYITPKTERGGYHAFEVQGLLPSGYGMAKRPLGLQVKANTLTEKWYDTWAKITGFREYVLDPKYKYPIGIREYEPFVIPDVGPSRNMLSMEQFDDVVRKANVQYADLYRYGGHSYQPLISYEILGRPLISSLPKVYSRQERARYSPMRYYKSFEYSKPSYYEKGIISEYKPVIEFENYAISESMGKYPYQRQTYSPPPPPKRYSYSPYKPPEKIIPIKPFSPLPTEKIPQKTKKQKESRLLDERQAYREVKIIDPFAGVTF